MKRTLITLTVLVVVAVGLMYAAKPPQASQPAPVTSERYADPVGLFTIIVPNGFTPDETYQYQLSPDTVIRGVKFTIPAELKGGTNLSTDSYISVETVDGACTADRFLDGTHNSTLISEGPTSYLVSSASNAGAGNRYDETVYAITGTDPCIAVRYFIHYTNVQNYEPGTIQEFDRAGLIELFDTMRWSLILTNN